MRRLRISSFCFSAATLTAVAGAVVHDAWAQQPVPVRMPPKIPVGIPHYVVPLTLSGCATTSLVLNLPVPAGPGRQVHFAATPTAGLSVSFDPADAFVAAGATTASTMMYVDYRPGGAASGDVPLTVTAGPAQQLYLIHREPMTISTISPTRVNSPRFMRPGDPITVTGTGLCQQATVRFANGVAPANIRQRSDGTQLTLTAPYDAGDGPITVADGDLSATTQAVSFDDVRHSWGFSFVNTDDLQNALGGYDLGDLQGDFGDGVIAPWNLAQAAAMLGWADAGLTNGNCFGFSTLAGRAVMGIRGSYPSWNGTDDTVPPSPAPATDTWHIFGPALTFGGPSSRISISRDIHRAQLMQLSSEALWSFLSATNLNGDPAGLRGALAGEFAQSRPMLVEIENSCNHAILAYDLHDLPGGGFLVDTYDPNVPFRNNVDTYPATHATRIRESTLHVNGDHTFSYQDDNGVGCSGSLSDVRALALGSIPQPPHGTMPGDLLDGLGHLVGAAEVAQVTDASGHTLLRADGSLNVDPSTRMANAVPFTPFVGQPVAGAGRYFYFKAPRVHTYAVRGRAAGTYSARYLGAGFIVAVDNVSIASGAVDSVSVDPSGAIDLRGASDKPFTATLTVRVVSGYRSFVVHGAMGAGGSTHIEVDAARDNITYRHAGPKTPVQFELSEVLAGNRKAGVTTTAIDVGSGDTLTLTPTWPALAAGVGSITQRTAAGALTTHPMK